MTYKGKTVLVTGSGGFIGSHLVDALLADGAHVRAFVRYTSHGWLGGLPPKSSLGENASKLDIFYGDIRDARRVADAVAGVDVVFHLAALIGIPYSYEAPESYVDTNVRGTLNVLEAARANIDQSKVVLTSTSEVYGTARRTHIDESHPLCAQSPYAASKIAADKLGEAYHRSYGLRMVTVRPFNTYGPRQSPRAIVPTILGQLLSGSNELRLGNLKPERDMMYVADTVRGFLLAGLSDRAIGKTINLATGVTLSVADMAEAACRATAWPQGKIHIRKDDSRVRPDASEVERLIGDWALAEDVLGWRPTTYFERGLDATLDWMRGHPPGEYRI